MTQITKLDTSSKPPPGWVMPIARTYITIAVPFLLALVSIRLVMTPLFLQIEYNRPGFSEDAYGLTTQERLTYASYAVNYLLNGADISYLGDLHFPDGRPMYNTRELHHMRDVKVITDYAYLLAVIGGLTALMAGYFLWRNARRGLRAALFNGSILALAIIAAIVLVAVVNWDFFFTGFHTLFFANGTWRFEYSDTLIRLFPEQFWFDASLTIGGLTVLVSLGLLVLMWRWNIKP